MPSIRSSDNLDWSCSSVPLPYLFTDLELPEFELSETILSAELQSQNIREYYLSFEEFFKAPVTAQQLDLVAEQLNEPSSAQNATEALLAYLFNFTLEQPKCDIDVTIQRSLELIPLLGQFLPVFAQETAKSLEIARNPPENLRATTSTSIMMNHLIEIVNTIVASANISGQQLPAGVVYEYFQATAQLIIAISGIVMTNPRPQTYNLSNARCFAGTRLLTLNRQCLLQLLGKTRDFDEVRRLMNEDTVKEPKKLPAPRFSGFVNPACQQMRILQQYHYDIEPWPFEQHNQNISQNTINDIYLLNDQILQKRKQFQNSQDFDSLTDEDIARMDAFYATLPTSTLSGSLEGAEQLHGAYLAIKMASDERVCKTNDYIQQNNNPNNSICYNCGSEKLQTGNQTTQFMKNRLSSSYTKQFSYSGRQNSEQCVQKELFNAIELCLNNTLIDSSKVQLKCLNSFPLNLYSGLINREKSTTLAGAQNESNLQHIIKSIDFPLYLHALARFGICGTPSTADQITMNHSMPEVNQSHTNNSIACIKHVRECVAKQVVCILYILLNKAEKVSHSLHKYVASLAFQTPELITFLSCLMAQPLGIYTTTPEQRYKEYSLNLFDMQDDFQTNHACTATQLLKNRPPEIKNQPLKEYSCSRRLMIVNAAMRTIYYLIESSRYRQLEFSKQFSKVSANYLSAMMQTVQQEEVENLSSNSRRESNVIGNVSEFSISAEQKDQLDPLRVDSFLGFVQGNNEMNNPEHQNMACTVTCGFPCFQALRVDNLPLLVAFLKASIECLPCTSTQESENTMFEITDLSDARNMVTKLAYLSDCQHEICDIFRFSKEMVCNGCEERNFNEQRDLLRAFRGILGVDWLVSGVEKGYAQFGASVVDAELGRCED